MKYYYLENGEVKAEYDCKSIINLLFGLKKVSFERRNTLSWYRESKDIKVLRTIDGIHIFCTEEHLNEFKK